MSAKALNCGHGSAERITIYHSGEGNCEACRVERFLGTDPFADDVERRDSAVAVGQEVKCPTCSEWILEGETCEDCERELGLSPDQWGKGLDDLASGKRFGRGYSPDIEHMNSIRGYRVGVWPQGPRASFIDLTPKDRRVKTFTEAVELLLTWKP